MRKAGWRDGPGRDLGGRDGSRSSVSSKGSERRSGGGGVRDKKDESNFCIYETVIFSDRWVPLSYQVA